MPEHTLSMLIVGLLLTRTHRACGALHNNMINDLPQIGSNHPRRCCPTPLCASILDYLSLLYYLHPSVLQPEQVQSEQRRQAKIPSAIPFLHN